MTYFINPQIIKIMGKMSKIRYILVSVIAAIAAVFVFNSCSRSGHKDRCTRDSVFIAKVVQDISNPQFSSVEQVQEYVRTKLIYQRAERVLLEMSDEDIIRVAKVCLNRRRTCDKLDIASEFMDHEDIYDTLRPAGEPKSAPPMGAINNPLEQDTLK